MAEHPDAVWSAILDGMEADLTSEMGPSGPGTWSAPTEAGPLPGHLADRASRILAAQRLMIATLTDDHRAVGRHLAALRTVPTAMPAGQSIYLDVVG
ncbi:MAG: hypothetical protein ABWX56_11515 [Mycetocola sp.]